MAAERNKEHSIYSDPFGSAEDGQHYAQSTAPPTGHLRVPAAAAARRSVQDPRIQQRISLPGHQQWERKRGE